MLVNFFNPFFQDNSYESALERCITYQYARYGKLTRETEYCKLYLKEKEREKKREKQLKKQKKY